MFSDDDHSESLVRDASYSVVNSPLKLSESSSLLFTWIHTHIFLLDILFCAISSILVSFVSFDRFLQTSSIPMLQLIPFMLTVRDPLFIIYPCYFSFFAISSFRVLSIRVTSTVYSASALLESVKRRRAIIRHTISIIKQNPFPLEFTKNSSSPSFVQTNQFRCTTQSIHSIHFYYSNSSRILILSRDSRCDPDS